MSTSITGATHTLTHDSVSETIDANLVKDGGFKDPELTNWTSSDAGSGESTHDALTSYESFPSVKLKITNTTDNAERYQDIIPDPDTTSFEFSAMIKTENLGADDDDKFVCIDIYYSDNSSELASSNADQKMTPSYDTGGWEQVTTSFSSNDSKVIDHLRVRCRLADISNQSGNGYMWVTHLIVTEATDEKENDSFNVDNDGDICVPCQLKITGAITHLVDQAIDVNEASFSSASLNATNEYLAQKFSPKQSKLSKVGIFVKKTGAPDDDLIVQLTGIIQSGAYPDETAVLAQTTISKDDITTSFEWYEVDLPFNMCDISKEMCIMLSTDATNLADGSIEYTWAGTTGSTRYANGSYWFSSDAGSTWSNTDINDAYFYTKTPVHCGEPFIYRSADAWSREYDTEYELGKATTYEKQAQTFLSDFTSRVYSVMLKPYTHTGTPTDDYVIVSIQKCDYDSTNSRWEPNGIILCEKRIAIDDWEDKESTTFTDGNIIEVIFEHSMFLQKEETYAIVIERSGALDDSNHFSLHGSDTSNNNYTQGKAMHWTGSAWTVGNANNDLSFAVRYTIDDKNIMIRNNTTGESLELDGQLLNNAELQINRDGRGTYTHDYFDDTNWDESPLDFIGDIRNTGGDYTIYSDNTYISGSGNIIFEYDFIFPCLSQPELNYKLDDATYDIYYSLNGADWVLLTSGTDEGATAITVKIPVVNISKLWLKFDGTATIKMYEWEVFADLDCSSAIGTLRLPGIGNSSCKSLFSNLNSKYTLDWEWTEVDGCTEYFVISDEPEYGYEMTAQVIPMGNPHPHTYHQTLKGSGIKQISSHSLGTKMINVIDYSTNFADLAKIREYLNDQRLVYVKTKYEFMQGILQEVPYKIISGEIDFRRLVIQLDETRQI